MIFNSAAAIVLEKALNQGIKLDPSTAAALENLSGKIIGIELTGTGLEFYLIFLKKNIYVQPQFDEVPDAFLRGAPLAMVKLGFSGNQQDVLFAGDIEMSGDTELGQRVKKIIDGIDIDWEEHLSRISGDVIAHQVGRAVRGFSKWASQSLHTLHKDVDEYLHDEVRMLPSRDQVKVFVTDVDMLRNDVERFEKRVERFQQTLKES